MKDALPDLFDVRSVNTDHEGLDGFYTSHELRICDVVGAFTPPGHTLIRFDADEHPWHGGRHLHNVGFDICDFHGWLAPEIKAAQGDGGSLRGCIQTSRCHIVEFSGMSRSTRKRMIVVASLLLVGLMVVGAILSRVFELGFVQTVIVAETIVTLVAIALGGVFALHKLEVFRDFQPHLTITQQISQRRIGDRYVHISVVARLTNSSKVVVEIRNALFRMQEISPVSNSNIEQMYFEFESKPNEEKYFQFPTLVEFQRKWNKDEFVIEPGEAESENYEFIVEDVFDTIKLTAFFTDQKLITEQHVERGWLTVSVYDIN